MAHDTQSPTMHNQSKEKHTPFLLLTDLALFLLDEAQEFQPNAHVETARKLIGKAYFEELKKLNSTKKAKAKGLYYRLIRTRK